MKHLCLISPFLPCRWSGRRSRNAFLLCWLFGTSASQNRWFCSWFTGPYEPQQQRYWRNDALL